MKQAAVMLLVLLAACGGEARRRSATVDTAVALPYDTFSHDSTDTLHATTAPTDSLMGSNTVPMMPSTAVVLRADSAAGDSLYHGKGRCFTCHGVQADGMATLGPSLIDSTWLHGNGSLPAIEGVIRNGIASPVVAQIAMPAFGAQLSPAEIHRIASYVYALTHRGAVVGDTTTIDSTRADTTHIDRITPINGLVPSLAAPRDTNTILY